MTKPSPRFSSRPWLTFISLLSILCPIVINAQSDTTGWRGQIAYISAEKDLILYDTKNKEYLPILHPDGHYIQETLRQINDSTLEVGFVKSCQRYLDVYDASYLPYEQLNRISHTFYKETYYAIDLSSHQTYKSRIVNHHRRDNLLYEWVYHMDKWGDTILFRQLQHKAFDEYGKPLNHTHCGTARWHSTTPTYQNKKIISCEGSLYLEESGQQQLILQNNRTFNSKFGNGYVQPDLSKDGTRTLFVHARPLSFTGSPVLEMELTTLAIDTVMVGHFFFPKYSHDVDLFLIQKMFDREENEHGYQLMVFNRKDQSQHAIDGVLDAIWLDTSQW